MSLVEARDHLEAEVSGKLIQEKKTGNWEHNIPEFLQISSYRYAFLIAYHGRTDYLRWLRQRELGFKDNGEEYELRDEEDERRFSDEMRFKLVRQPGIKELPSILVRFWRDRWKDASLGGGTLIVVYDKPYGLPEDREVRRTHSLYLPPNETDKIILTNHLTRPKGFRARLKNLNPLAEHGLSQVARIEDIKALDEMIGNASFYQPRKVDLVYFKVVPIPNPADKQILD